MAEPSNANDAYFNLLTGYGREKNVYEPAFSVRDGPVQRSKVRGKDWDDVMLEVASVNVGIVVTLGAHSN